MIENLISVFGWSADSAADIGGAGGARAPPKLGGSEKGWSLIFAYRSLPITTNTPGFKKLSTAEADQQKVQFFVT